MCEKLDASLFAGHNAEEYPLGHVKAFCKDTDVVYRVWSSSMTCDYCNYRGLSYYREEIAFYNSTLGFYLSDDENTDGEQVDFAVYHCPQCGKWFTYIE